MKIIINFINKIFIWQKKWNQVIYYSKQKQNAQEVYSLDYSKCHCSILMQMEYIPVINLFDDFVDYDPEEEIKPYSLYLLSK